MPKYEKWLGAGLGWVITGSPLGGMLGFLAGSFMGQNKRVTQNQQMKGLSELESNIIVLASHLMKIDGHVNFHEIAFTQNFLDTHFDESLSSNRKEVINHCIAREYDLSVVCDQLRLYTEHNTRVQIVRFLFDLAHSDGEFHENENYFIFRIAGYLNVNDVEFRKIRKEHFEITVSIYEILGVSRNDSMEKITNVYRKMVLEYHPDRHPNATYEEKQMLSQKFQQIKEAYNRIKAEKT